LSPAEATRVRFAPSPTGALHVGNARTALFNWLHARSLGGTFVLRIEDTDTVRSTSAFEAQIVDDLRWLGLGWDEGIEAEGSLGPYRQSERLGLYRDSARAILERRIAYPCFCTVALLEEERQAQRAAGSVSVYSGRCRGLDPAEAAARRAAGEPCAVRFNVAAAAAQDDAVVFEDLIRGTIRFPVSQIGDFVLLRQDGTPAYNFAVVVDDLLMRISDVIRGDDHLSNTPRQVLIYRALGAPAVPRFAHLPLIVAPGGAPLSKREGAASVAHLRSQGYPAEALLNHLALLGWSPPGGADFLTREELLREFDLRRVAKAPAVFDPQKLDALSMRHIARMTPEQLTPLALEHLARAGKVDDPAAAEVVEWVSQLAAAWSERLVRLGDLPGEAALVFDFSPEASLADEEVRSTLADPRARLVIETLLSQAGSEPITAQRFSAMAAEVRRATGAKGRDLFHPIRIGLTGRGVGPELVRIVPIIDAGSRLTLPRPVVSCAGRAAALLAATRANSPTGPS
jgi:glutamyl-tRNA synthetase/nondiscriminating glutamyl-tRNA synthetase